MNRMVKALLIGLILVLLMLVVAVNAGAAGFGVGPLNLEITDALRGEEYQETVFGKYTAAASESQQCLLELSAGGDISEWISFYNPSDPTTPIESMSASAGEWTYIMVKFNIPGDAPIGAATGTIHVRTAPPENGTEGEITVSLQGTVDVNLTVTGTRILAGVVDRVTAQDTEAGSPLRIEVHFINTGNVAATPQIDVEITKDDAAIDSFTFAETKVNSGKSEAVLVEWDTNGEGLGDYSAHVDISLDEEVIATDELDFAILPVGTLTRAGVFENLSLQGEAKLGTLTKVQATFFNTGRIDTKAKFIGELYCDNELIDTLESEEALVLVEQREILTSYVMPEEEGDYDVKGYINYEGKRTEVKEISFRIGEAGGGHSFNWLILTVMVIAILAGVIVYMALRRKRGKPA
jgi:hypothetical protein